MLPQPPDLPGFPLPPPRSPTTVPTPGPPPCGGKLSGAGPTASRGLFQGWKTGSWCGHWKRPSGGWKEALPRDSVVLQGHLPSGPGPKDQERLLCGFWLKTKGFLRCFPGPDWGTGPALGGHLPRPWPGPQTQLINNSQRRGRRAGRGRLWRRQGGRRRWLGWAGVVGAGMGTTVLGHQ